MTVPATAGSSHVTCHSDRVSAAEEPRHLTQMLHREHREICKDGFSSERQKVKGGRAALASGSFHVSEPVLPGEHETSQAKSVFG